MSTALERFLRYTTFSTQSVEKTGKVPSSEGQMVFAKAVAKELEELGLSDVRVDEHAYVTATLPANTDRKIPTIGFNAHLDTALEVTGADVKARVVHYEGGDIVLNESLGVVMSPVDFPDLNDYVGQDIVVTDGTTLLGSDDKAGMAAIMGAVDHLVHHPEIRHGAVKVSFTPDEEIGHGASLLDIEAFGADFAYTVDAGPVGQINYETFNAARADIKVHGRAVHPGTSKDKMLNATLLGTELLALLPPAETPSHTEKYEGFFHVTSFKGAVEEATVSLIVRDHDRTKFAQRKEFMKRAVKWMQDKYGADRFELELSDTYYNMRDVLEKHMHIVETATQAMEALGITPKIVPIRGGTDGSQLTYRGLPCPNIFYGGHNAHGKFEFLPVPSLEKSVKVILKILDIYASK